MHLLKAGALTIAASSLLWVQIAFVHQAGLANLPGSAWRFWDDMTIAIARFVDRTSGAPRLETSEGDLAALAGHRALVESKIENTDLKPTEFWRTVNDQKFRLKHAPFAAPKFEDPGRSLLLLAGFRVLGGVAPYLLVWIGALAFIPVLFWISWEFVATGHGTAGLGFATLVSFSPYWAECLSLPHSAVAFYLGGLVALAAFAMAAFLPRAGGPLAWRSLAWRGALLAALLIVDVWCRSGSIFFVPVAIVVATIGFHRGGLSKARASALALALIALPVAALRPHEVHSVWAALWEGLGDFGTDHGYSWYDADASRHLGEHHGLPVRRELRYITAAEEKAFGEDFIHDVTTNPLWYARVLGRRLAATTLLTHLDPWGPRDGESRRTPLFHYKYTTPVDWFGWEDGAREVPVSVLYVPTLVLILASLARRPAGLGELGVLGAIAAATLPVPVLITTAGALETQAFTLVYFLGAAFLLQRGVDTLTNRFQRA